MSRWLLILYTFLWWSGVTKWNNLCRRHFRCAVCAAWMVNCVGRNVSVYYIYNNIYCICQHYVQEILSKCRTKAKCHNMGWPKVDTQFEKIKCPPDKMSLNDIFHQNQPILGVDIQSINFGSKCPKDEMSRWKFHLGTFWCLCLLFCLSPVSGVCVCVQYHYHILVMNSDTDTYTDNDKKTGRLLEILKWRNAGLFGTQSVKFGLSTFIMCPLLCD
jgi:hypothetical protein